LGAAVVEAKDTGKDTLPYLEVSDVAA